MLPFITEYLTQFCRLIVCELAEEASRLEDVISAFKLYKLRSLPLRLGVNRFEVVGESASLNTPSRLHTLPRSNLEDLRFEDLVQWDLDTILPTIYCYVRVIPKASRLSISESVAIQEPSYVNLLLRETK